METIVTVVSAIASLVGAGLAAWQAKRSSTFAEIARRAQNAVLERKRIQEASRVLAESRRVLSSVSRVGATATPTSIRGLNVRDIAAEVESYVRLIREQADHYGGGFNERADALSNELRPLIEDLAAATDFNGRKSAGKGICYAIEDFLPAVKKLVDDHQSKGYRAGGDEL